MENRIRVITKKVGEGPKVELVENEYNKLKSIVGGYIETVPFVKGRLLLVCNEEGKLNGLKPNVYLQNDVICGNCFITKFDGREDFEDLSESDISFVRKKINEFTIRCGSELKDGECKVITSRRAYDAICALGERGNIFYAVPSNEPIIGFLQDSEQLNHETKHKKEEETEHSI